MKMSKVMSLHKAPSTPNMKSNWMRNQDIIVWKRRSSLPPTKFQCTAFPTITNTMNMDEVLHMETGQGKYSYVNNSFVQRRIIEKGSRILEESVKEMCNTMTSLPNLLTIADLGCSSGPNAFEAIWEIINVSSNLYQSKNVGLPEFKVFLNDLIGNDFNTLFRSLPEFHRKLKDANFGQCFVSATPESFHGRLFPNDFLHLVHASSSVHFLSQVPEGLVTKDGVALNKGAISMTKKSSPKVHEAYSKQFANDFTLFLSSRSKEIVRGGQMILNFRGSTQSDKPDYIQDYELLGLALHNLVLKGSIKEKELDGFNVPFYTPSIEEVQRLIEMQESFTINNIETFTIDWDLKDTDLILTLNERAKHASYSFRAITSPILASQFGALVIDELFDQFEAMVMQCLEVGKLDMMNFVISMAKK